MKRLYSPFLFVVLLTALIVSLLACDPIGEKEYDVSGTVQDVQGDPMADVHILFSQDGKALEGTAQTDEEGRWSMLGLQGTVTVMAQKEGFALYPSSRVVEDTEDGVDFTGSRQEITVIGPGGGTATSQDEKFLLDIEGGSLSEDISIAINPAPLEAPQLFGTLYEVGPSGTVFHPPARLTLYYDALNLPEGLTPEEEEDFLKGLRLGRFQEGIWEPLPSTLDEEEKSLTAPLSSLSRFGLYPRQQYVVMMGVLEGLGTVKPGSGKHYFAPGETLSLQAVPDEGWVFKEWRIYTSSTEAVPIVDDNAEVSDIVLNYGDDESDWTLWYVEAWAYFEPDPDEPQVALHVGKEGSGTVEPGVGTHYYPENTVVTLSAQAEDGWWFECWTLSTGGLSGEYREIEEPEYSFTLTEETTARALFHEAPETRVLTMTTEGEGYTSPPVGSKEYPLDWEVRLTAYPGEDGWHFERWVIQYEGEDPYVQSDYTMTLIMSDHVTVRAIFAYDFSYTLSGYAKFDHGGRIDNVEISFSGGHESVKTDMVGYWEKEGLTGPVVVTAHKDNLSFTPNRYEVLGPTHSLNFTALPDYDLEYYDTVKIMGEEEQQNIQSRSDSSITFKEITPFVEQLRPGDILVARYLGSGVTALEVIPEEGVLLKVTSTRGHTIDVEDGYLEDTIRSGDLIIAESYPYEEMFVDLEGHPGILIFDPIEKTLEFEKELAEGVALKGHLKFELDFALNGTVSFAEGVEDCTFSISPSMEVDLQFTAEKEATLAREFSLYTWDPTHIRVPIFPGAFFQPRIEFVVGARGSLEASMETGVHYSREITAGIQYTRADGWERISHMPDGPWQVQTPEFAASMEGEAYAGVKFSGIVNHVVGLHAGPYLFLDTNADINMAAFLWQYRMGIGLKLGTGASLEVLRIASLSYDLPPINLYRTNIAYGISGQVVDFDIMGLEDAIVTFTGEKGPFTPVQPAGELGFWYKHLLQGDVLVRPELEGYTFVEEAIEVDDAESKVNFFGKYEIRGFVRDREGEGIEGVELTFDRAIFSDMKPQTSADGSWQQKELYGLVNVTPFKEGYAFEPNSIPVDTYNTAVNFTGTYEVSGYVRDEVGNAIPNVHIHFSDAEVESVLTNEQGYFERDGLSGPVTVTPALDDMVFAPTQRVVEGPESNLEFVLGYTVSGYVLDLEDMGIGGIEITFLGSEEFSPVTTASDGRWEKRGLYDDVVVIPNTDGYAFDPYSRLVHESTTGVNFRGTYEATGWVLDQYGEGVPDIDIGYMTAPDRHDSLRTDENGFWSVEGLSGVTTFYTPYSERVFVISKPTYDLLVETEIFNASGYVRNNLGDGIGGQEIRFNLHNFMSIKFDSVYTDSTGYWSKENLVSKIDVRPYSKDYFIKPGVAVVSAENAEEEIDFIATYRINGYIKTADGTGLWTKIYFTGDESYPYVHSSTASGYYTAGGFSGTVTVTPSAHNYYFSPSSQTVSSRTEGLNFTAYPKD